MYCQRFSTVFFTSIVLSVSHHFFICGSLSLLDSPSHFSPLKNDNCFILYLLHFSLTSSFSLASLFSMTFTFCLLLWLCSQSKKNPNKQKQPSKITQTQHLFIELQNCWGWKAPLEIFSSKPPATLNVRKFFLMLRWNCLWFCLWSLLPVLSLGTTEESLTPSIFSHQKSPCAQWK